MLSCSSAAGMPARSPLEIARLSYVDASLVYEVTMRTVSDLRAARLLSDPQWSRVEHAQSVVRVLGPQVRAALDLWAVTGREPVDYSVAIGKLYAAFAEIKTVRAEVF
jgi:hypothetical protein